MPRRRGTLTLRREDGRIICEHVRIADTYTRRTIGLLGRKSLPQDEGIVLRPSFSIHTFFMRFPIDLIFLDQDLVVIKLAENLRPFRTSSCRGAREVVELAAGECARRGLSVGDRVAWASHTATAAIAGGGRVGPDSSRGRVIIASRDARFVKLARFLLDAKEIETVATAPADRLPVTLARESAVDAVILDAHDSVASSLATANSARAARPEVKIVLVAESSSAERSPAGVRIYDKWNETDDFVAAVEEAVIRDDADPDAVSPPLDMTS